MRGLDTNVLLRPLLQDDPVQSATVEAFFRESQVRGERLFVSAIVLCETCWALRGAGYSRSEIAAAIEGILGTALFEIQGRELVRRALEQYRQGPADFSDYLIGWQSRQAGCMDTLTFDRGLEKAPGFSLLTGLHAEKSTPAPSPRTPPS